MDVILKKPSVIQVYQTDPFLSGQGGGVRYVKNLLEGTKSGCDKILFFGVGSDSKQRDNVSFVPVTKILGNYAFFLISLFFKILRMDLSSYDVVHVHRSYFAIPFLIAHPNLKIVCSLHGRTFSVIGTNAPLVSKLLIPLFRLIEFSCLRKIDTLVPVSRDVLNNFIGKYPSLVKKHIEIIGSMTDLKRFKLTTSDYLQTRFGFDCKYILFIGRIAAVKDIDFLLDVFLNFQSRSDVKLVIAGTGELMDFYMGKSEQLFKSNKPLFLGEVPPKDIPDLISSSDLLVLTSNHEASPTVIKESLSCGIPVLSTEVGDVDEFIYDGINGFVVKKEKDDFSNKLKFILDNGHHFSKKMVYDSSKNDLLSVSIDHVSSKYIKLYKKEV